MVEIDSSRIFDWGPAPGRPQIILAPMEGVTDEPMRALLTELGGFTFCVSEFMRISQDVPGKSTFHHHVPELKHQARTPSGIRVHFQLLGGNAEKLALAAQRACDEGARGVDLNFGCPSHPLIGHDGGASLLKHPDRIYQIVRTVRAAVPADLPVSAKMRLGWESMNDIHHNAERAAEAGASWITIHGRTKEQGYRPPAYWGPIGEVNRRLGRHIPIIANGDLWNLDAYLRCRDETQCEHYLLGRSALANPHLARQIAGLQTESTRWEERETWVPLLKRFSEITPVLPKLNSYLARRSKQWLNFARIAQPLPWWEDVKRMDSFADIIAYLETGHTSKSERLLGSAQH